MFEIFASTFVPVAEAVGSIFLIALAAGLLVRKRVVTQTHIEGLATVTVNVLLPCLIFSSITSQFDSKALPFWWLLPFAAAGMVAIGMGAAVLAFARELPAKRNMLPLAGMQNAGYLVLPIGRLVFPDEFELFALYCFLMILGYSPLLWSVGKYLATTGGEGAQQGWRGLLTPPLYANVVALALALTGARRFVPEMAQTSIGMLGGATVPVALFVLGGTLGSIPLSTRPPLWDTLRVLGIKLLLLPALMIVVLRAMDLDARFPLLASVLVLQASSAPATGLIIQIRKYGGDYGKAGSITALAYLCCVATIPLWMGVWRLVA